MLKNYLFRFNWWLDIHEVVKFIGIIIYIVIANLFLMTGWFGLSGIIIGVIMYMIVSIFSLYRVKVLDGRIQFNHDLCKLPEIGEVITFTKPYRFIRILGEVDVYKGRYIVRSITKQAADFEINLEITNKSIKSQNYGVLQPNYYHKGFIFGVKYYHSRKYWRTLSELRNDKLKKLVRN